MCAVINCRSPCPKVLSLYTVPSKARGGEKVAVQGGDKVWVREERHGVRYNGRHVCCCWGIQVPTCKEEGRQGQVRWAWQAGKEGSVGEGWARKRQGVEWHGSKVRR